MTPRLSTPITAAILAACEEADAWMTQWAPGDLGKWLDEHRDHPQFAAMSRIGGDADHDRATWEETLAEVRRRAALEVPVGTGLRLGSGRRFDRRVAALRPPAKPAPAPPTIDPLYFVLDRAIASAVKLYGRDRARAALADVLTAHGIDLSAAPISPAPAGGK